MLKTIVTLLLVLLTGKVTWCKPWRSNVVLYDKTVRQSCICAKWGNVVVKTVKWKTFPGNDFISSCRYAIEESKRPCDSLDFSKKQKLLENSGKESVVCKLGETMSEIRFFLPQDTCENIESYQEPCTECYDGARRVYTVCYTRERKLSTKNIVKYCRVEANKCGKASCEKNIQHTTRHPRDVSTTPCMDEDCEPPGRYQFGWTWISDGDNCAKSICTDHANVGVRKYKRECAKTPIYDDYDDARNIKRTRKVGMVPIIVSKSLCTSTPSDGSSIHVAACGGLPLCPPTTTMIATTIPRKRKKNKAKRKKKKKIETTTTTISTMPITNDSKTPVTVSPSENKANKLTPGDPNTTIPQFPHAIKNKTSATTSTQVLTFVNTWSKSTVKSHLNAASLVNQSKPVFIYVEKHEPKVTSQPYQLIVTSPVSANMMNSQPRDTVSSKIVSKIDTEKLDTEKPIDTEPMIPLDLVIFILSSVGAFAIIVIVGLSVVACWVSCRKKKSVTEHHKAVKTKCKRTQNNVEKSSSPDGSTEHHIDQGLKYSTKPESLYWVVNDINGTEVINQEVASTISRPAHRVSTFQSPSKNAPETSDLSQFANTDFWDETPPKGIVAGEYDTLNREIINQLGTPPTPPTQGDGRSRAIASRQKIQNGHAPQNGSFDDFCDVISNTENVIQDVMTDADVVFNDVMSELTSLNNYLEKVTSSHYKTIQNGCVYSVPNKEADGNEIVRSSNNYVSPIRNKSRNKSARKRAYSCDKQRRPRASKHDELNYSIPRQPFKRIDDQ